jgi:hypothetical protein
VMQMQTVGTMRAVVDAIATTVMVLSTRWPVTRGVMVSMRTAMG